MPAATPRLVQGLNALDSRLLARVSSFKQDGAIDPAVLAAGAARAQARVALARQKAKADRSAATTALIVTGNQKLQAAKQRLQQGRAVPLREPRGVLSALTDAARARVAAAAPVRLAPRALLVRGQPATPAKFCVRLARVLGLDSAADLDTLGFRVQAVDPAHGSRSSLFAVRVPLGNSELGELNNIAWALRKSAQFTSVRVDGLLRTLFASPTHLARADEDFAWPLRLTRVLEARALPPLPGGKALGEGIVIAHPDTGWAPHPQLGVDRIDVALSHNAATGQSGGDAARHSTRSGDSLLPNVTHGTATASIMIGGTGNGTERSTLAKAALGFDVTDDGKRNYGSAQRVMDGAGVLTGVAPQATVRPIKFIDDQWLDVDRTGINGAGVVRVADEDLVRAIDYARTSGAHVISLSIGGLMHDEVQRAIDRAVEDANMIVVAAAGQTYAMERLGLNTLAALAQGLGVDDVDSVTLPAAYANVIAVAGCCPNGRPWDESLRGPNIDIAAPADGVWAADFMPGGPNPSAGRTPTVEAASGTSFAAAFMAGVAALWLAHHGRDSLEDQYPSIPLAWVFRHQLQLCATAVPSASWDSQSFGPGVVNVQALLELDLPRPRDVRRPPATHANAFTVLSGFADTPEAQAQADAWAMLYDWASESSSRMAVVAEAATAFGRAAAEATLAASQQVLAELHAVVDAGQVAIAEARETLEALENVVDAAAELAEETQRAAAEAGDAVIDAAVAAVDGIGNAFGEAAEDVADALFGWLD
jgi:hypothetical protein